MRSLIFLLLTTFISSLAYQTEYEIIDIYTCIESCICPKERNINGNGHKILKVYSRYFERLYNNNCIKFFPYYQIRIGNSCKNYFENDVENDVLVVKKPVIYLYPKENMDISVKLNLKNSKFTTIYPKFNDKNIWNVKAKPNGDILINNRTYPYLFWEAKSYSSQETDEGFIVTKENAEKFLEEKLEILGLNEKEKTDFITFWLPVLLRNKLNLCTFQSKKFFDNIELNITPKPDSLIRVFLTIKKLDNSINIKEQKLVSNERKGFTVIEWGGSNI